MNTTPTSFSGDEDVNMVKKFYIVSCAALVASLCLFSQDADAGGKRVKYFKFAQSNGQAYVKMGEIRLAQRASMKRRRATINRRQRAGIGKLKGSTQGPVGAGMLLPIVQSANYYQPPPPPPPSNTQDDCMSCD